MFSTHRANAFVASGKDLDGSKIPCDDRRRPATKDACSSQCAMPPYKDPDDGSDLCREGSKQALTFSAGLVQVRGRSLYGAANFCAARQRLAILWSARRFPTQGPGGRNWPGLRL